MMLASSQTYGWAYGIDTFINAQPDAKKFPYFDQAEGQSSTRVFFETQQRWQLC